MIHSEPTTFRYLYGAVYILENTEAKRVKVGMTINNVEGRLKDVNDMWLGIKATCQICGGRRFVDQEGFVPTHVVSGRRCQGSKTFPLEKDSTIAEFHLKELRSSLDELFGIEKNSITRKVATLANRIEQFRKFSQVVGEWKINTIYYTKCAEQIELLSHEVLINHLDNAVPFGEVFSCSALEARNAIESVLTQLDLLQLARKENRYLNCARNHAPGPASDRY